MHVYTHVCVCRGVYACMCVKGSGHRSAPPKEEFCSADDYTCRADATPAAAVLSAKVGELGWHTEGLKGTVWVSLSEIMF